MTARQTIIAPTTFQIPTLQVPFEMLQNNLLEAQSSKDDWDSFSSLMPNALQQDLELLSKYKQLVNKVSNDVADSFAGGQTSKALRQLQEAKRTVTREWKPGGMADVLNQRYNQDIAAKKQIEERFANDLKEGNSINYNLAKMSYSIPDVGYDPNTGKYNQIGAPDVPTYFDYNKELQEWIKTVDPKKFGNWSKTADGRYINETSGEIYNMREFAAQFMNDPRVQQQLRLEGQYQTLQLSPEQRMFTVQQLNDTAAKSAESLKSELASLEKNLSSPDKKKRMEAQYLLAKKGYSVDGKIYDEKEVDGEIGKRTQAALEQLRKDVNEYQPQQFTEDDLPAIFAKEKMTGVATMAELAKPSWQINKFGGADPYKLEAVKHSYKKAEQKQLMDGWSALQTPTAMPTTSTAIDFNQMEAALKATQEATQASKSVLTDYIKSNPALTAIFKDPKGQLSPEEFAAKARMSFDKNRGDMASVAKELGMDTQMTEAMFEIFNRPEYKEFAQTAVNYSEGIQAESQIQNTNNQIKAKYIERKGLQDAEKVIKRYGWGAYGVTPEILVNNPDKVRKMVPPIKLSGGSQGYSPVSPGSSISANANKDLLSIFQDNLIENINKDIKENNDAYATAVPKGLRTNSKNFGQLEDAWQEWSVGEDEFGGTEWKQIGGKGEYENIDLVGKPDIQIQKAIGKQGFTVVMTGTGKTGEKGKNVHVEKRIYISDPDKANYIKNEIAGALADANNANDLNTALRAIQMLEGDNVLNERISPTGPGSRKGTYTSTNSKGENVTNLNFNFNVLESFQNRINTSKGTFTDGDISLITLPKGAEGKQWAIVKQVGNSVYELDDVVGNADGNVAVYQSREQAEAAFKWIKEKQENKYTGKVPMRIQKDAISPLPTMIQ